MVVGRCHHSSSFWSPFHGLFALLGLLLITCALSQSTDTNDSGSDEFCSNNFFKMEQSLLQNTQNRYNLMKIFYPSNEAHPVLVRVNYSFTESLDEDMSVEGRNSNQIWFWSESEFYLIQPMEVFQFTSLLFGNMPYRQSDLSIVLDHNCTDAPEEFFQHLTIRLQLYSQSATTGPNAPTQRVSISYAAIAVKLEKAAEDQVQSTFVKVWIHITVILFPILSWLLLYLCDPVQLLLGDKTWTKLDDEHTHGTLAAMIQISVLFTFFVFVLDILGVYFSVNDTFIEYYDHNHVAFYLSTVSGLIVDIGAFMYVVIVILSSVHWNFKKFIVKLWNRSPDQHSDSKRVKKLFSTVTVAPVLCMANHSHYIIIAFLADPFYAGSTAIVYTLSFFLYFFIFRQFYNRVVLHSNKQPKIVSRMELCPKCSAREKLWNPLSRLSSEHLITEEMLRLGGHPEEKQCNCFIPGPNCHAPFSTEMVVIGIAVIGPFLMIYQAIILILFLNLPITKSLEDAPSRLYTIYQGTGLIIVALLTYNILLNPTPFSIAKTIERLAKRLRLPENTNFWNRLSIEEKLAKVLVTLLETHFHNTGGGGLEITNIKKSPYRQRNSQRKNEGKEINADTKQDDDNDGHGIVGQSSSSNTANIICASPTHKSGTDNGGIQLHIYSSRAEHEVVDGLYATEI